MRREYVVRGTVHDVRGGDFHSKTHGGEARSDHNDPEDFDGCEWED